MIRVVLAETTWRDWLVCFADLVGVVVIVVSIAVIAIGFAPQP